MSRDHIGKIVRVLPQAWRVFRMGGWRGVAWEVRRRLRPTKHYAEWVRAFDTLTPEARARIAERIAAAKERPLISVLMPTYNTNSAWLQAAIDSVRAQLYPHWQLCIADDASTAPHVRQMLLANAEADSRIKLVFRQTNGHISAASNSALELASGTWVVLMDHDDVLAEDALYHVVRCAAEHQGARLIYSDEDKIDAHGARFDPYFKPDWNPELFHAYNMVNHLTALATDLVRAVGGFREGLEGSQDWDLLLRCVERLEPSQVQHIPRILYHWRVHPESTARSMGAKPYAAVAGERALNEHFARLGVRATAEYEGLNHRVRYDLPSPAPLVSIIVPTRNSHELVRQCLESILRKTDYPDYEVILVDNGSDDPASLDYFREVQLAQPQVRVLRDEREFNFSALNNAAVRHARGAYVVLLNNDIEVETPGWLAEMVSIAAQPGVGAVGARLWYPDHTLQHGGVILAPRLVGLHAHKRLPAGLRGYAGRAAVAQNFSAVTAACLVVRKSLFEAVGGLDEVNLKIAFNDVDFCLRLREAGLRNVWTPYAELMHHESATRGSDLDPARRGRFEREAQYMRERWGKWLEHDPAYNPNLTVDREDFSYAWPPRGALW